MEEIIGDAEAPGQVTRVLDILELHAISSKEPSSFTKLEHSEAWRTVIIEER
jgi:hypothetical protein